MESIFILISYFAVFAFLGSMMEIIFLVIEKKKLKGRGFLYGPFSPIYGFGALAIYFFEFYFGGLDLPIKLVAYFFIPTGIEFFTSYALEKVFNLRVWDYSKYNFNINGRVCLGISALWFIFGILVVYKIQPFFLGVLNKIPLDIIQMSSIIMGFYLLADIFFSFKKNFKLKGKKLRWAHN